MGKKEYVGEYSAKKSSGKNQSYLLVLILFLILIPLLST